MSANSTRKKRTIILSIISSVSLLLVLTLVTMFLGRVQGVEFAPSHFTQREFHFWEVPLIHLQVTPIYQTSRSTPTINLLRSKNYISAPTTPPTTYHIVELQRSSFAQATPADAEILVRYLQLSDRSSNYVWEKWSRDNPQAAAVFWPVIQQLASRELYLLMPDLFALAQKQTDAKLLAADIDKNLQQAYRDLAQDLIDAEKPSLAAAVLADAKQDFPNNKSYDEMLDQLP